MPARHDLHKALSRDETPILVRPLPGRKRKIKGKDQETECASSTGETRASDRERGEILHSHTAPYPANKPKYLLRPFLVTTPYVRLKSSEEEAGEDGGDEKRRRLCVRECKNFQYRNLQLDLRGQIAEQRKAGK